MDLKKLVRAFLVVLAILAIGLVVAGCTSVEDNKFVEDTTPYNDKDLVDEYVKGYDAGIATPKTTEEAVDVEPEVVVEGVVVPVEGTTEADVAEYTTKVLLGQDIESTLDDNDLQRLYSGKISFNGDNIDVDETLTITDDVVLGYSGDLTFDEDFGDKPYLVGDTHDTLAYVYTFKDDVALADISEDETLEINFLGVDMTIINADSGEITYYSTPSAYMKVGESVVTDGKTLVLLDANSDAVIVAVDDITDVVNEGSTKTVNGVRIYVRSTFSRDTKEQSSAMLVFGEDSKQTVQSGDYYDDSNQWVWEIEDDGTDLQSISLSLDEKFNRIDSAIEALGVGSCISYPEQYAKLCLGALNDVDWASVYVDFDTIDVSTVDTDVTSITSEGNIIYVDSERVNKIYVDSTGVIYYKDGSDYIAASDIFATIKLDSTDYEVAFSLGQTIIIDEDGNWITLDTDADNQRLGSFADDAEVTDVMYNGDSFGTRDNMLTAFGVKILDIESNADNDEVELSLPDEKLEATLEVY